MKKLICAALVGLCGLVSCAEAEKDDYTGFLLWPYVDEASFSGLTVNLFSAEFETFNGCAITGFYSRESVGEGFALSLLSTHARDRFDGVAIAGGSTGGKCLNGGFFGLLSATGENLRGYAGAALFNDFSRVDGWSDGLFCNRADLVNGCQTALCHATCEGDLNGCQIACVALTRKRVNGVQIGIFNIAGEELDGAQIGLFNIAPGTLNLPILNCGRRTK